MRSDPLRAEQRTLVSSLLELRLVVAALGEASRWWRSTFLSPTGLSFLQRIYPRTFVAAAIRSASEAARREHDTKIGRGQVVHLFRLPAVWERALDDTLREWDQGAQAEHQRMLAAPDGALAALRELAGGQNRGTATGPVNCGNVSRIAATPTLALVAAHYLSGFEAKRSVYPYLEVGR